MSLGKARKKKTSKLPVYTSAHFSLRLSTKWAKTTAVKAASSWKAMLTDCHCASVLRGESTVGYGSKTSQESGDQSFWGCKWRRRSPFNYARTHTRALHRISLSTREGRVIDHEEERVGEQASLWCGVTDRPKARLHWYYPWFWIDRKGKGNRKREPRWKQLIREKGKGLLKRREDDRGKTFWSCFHCGKWFSTVAQRTELWKWPKTKGEGDIDDINVSLEGRRDVVEQSSNY